MRKYFLYLVAIMDWHSQKVLSLRLANSMDTDFCIAALEETLTKYASPDIFNPDQGSQFISFAFTNVLREQGIRISMGGHGRWVDNVFIKRLWGSLQYERVYLTPTKPARKPRQVSTGRSTLTTTGDPMAAWWDNLGYVQ
jgi:putative transposase